MHVTATFAISSTSSKHPLPPSSIPAVLVCVLCFAFLSFFFCPWCLAVTSIRMCIAEENLSIFHSITAENARSTSGEKKKNNRGEVLECNKRVAGAECRSRSGRRSRPAERTALPQLYRTCSWSNRPVSVLSSSINDRQPKNHGVLLVHIQADRGSYRTDFVSCVQRYSFCFWNACCTQRLFYTSGAKRARLGPHYSSMWISRL